MRYAMLRALLASALLIVAAIGWADPVKAQAWPEKHLVQELERNREIIEAANIKVE